MKWLGRILALGLAGIVLVVFLGYMFGIFFIVPETHSVVLKRFGDIRKVIVPGYYQGPGNENRSNPQIQYIKEEYGTDTSTISVSTGAGLYFKPPWWNATYFDARILDWDGQEKEISTEDLRTLQVDATARWRILDPVRFYRAAGANEHQAQSRLDSVINSQVEDEISTTRLIEVVRNERLALEERVKKQLKTVEEEEAKSAKIRYGRQELVRSIEEQAAEELMERFGVKLVDVLLTRINYTSSVRKQVYDRMISERERIAARYRAQGEKARRTILGEVQRRKDELLSNAERRVQEILGRAEARSITIQAEAHQRAPGFYQFMRSLETYETSMDTQSTLILSDENQLLQYTTAPPE
jgi:membrane protease subunit HflC